MIISVFLIPKSECRAELYLDDYNSIQWDSCRNLCAKEDLYYPHSLLQVILWAYTLVMGGQCRKSCSL